MNSDNHNQQQHQHQRDDPCVDQLYQLFQSCDTTGNGLLGTDELFELLQLLQLDDHQTNFIITNLIGNDLFAKVDFNDFKETFVALLTESNFEESFHLTNTNSNSNLSTTASTTTTLPLQTKTNCAINSPSHVLQQDELNQISSTNLYDGNTEDYLKSIWNHLGVGQNGYLDMKDLYRVCEHIGMVGINDDIIQQLFDKLDHDQDGKVSFDEFLQGLFQYHNNNDDNLMDPTNGSNVNFIQSSQESQAQQQQQELPQPSFNCATNLNGTNLNETLNDSEDLLMEHKTSFCSNVTTYLISMDPDKNGYIQPENILKLWESLGFDDAIAILKKMGLNTKAKINIQELITQLEENLSSNDTELFQVSLATFQHEFTQLRINYEQVKVERDRLRISIAESNARVDLLAQEVDEHHAKIEESSQNKLNLLEKKYQDHIRSLEDELHKTRETQATQSFHLEQNIIKELSTAQEQEAKLRDRIIALEQENKRLEKEIHLLNEKFWETQKMCIDLQKQTEENDSMRKKIAEFESMQGFLRDQEQHNLLQENEGLKLHNKELQDHNDELLLELENMKQQLIQRSVKRNKKLENRLSEQSRRLSDYIELDKSNNMTGIRALKRRGNDTSSDENSEDDSSTSERTKRIVLSAKTHMEVDALTDVPIETERIERESISQTISKGELFREIDSLKDQLTKEVKRRDQLINDRERTEHELRENYEKIIINKEDAVKELRIINNTLKSDIKETKRKLINDIKCLQDKMNQTLDKDILTVFNSQINHDNITSLQNYVQQTKVELLKILCEMMSTLDIRDYEVESIKDEQDEGLQRRFIDDERLSKENESTDTNFERLLKDLYDKNSKLNQALQLNEEKQKKVEQENSRLNYKCKVLSKLLSEISSSSF